MTRPRALLGRTIGPALRERIILRVSSVNSCTICSAVHGVVARLEGLTHDDIRNVRASSGEPTLDPRTAAALRFAELRTAQLEMDFPEDVAAFERSFSEDEQREIRAVVDLFTFNNRFNNTWEAVLPGARRRRKSMGLPV